MRVEFIDSYLRSCILFALHLKDCGDRRMYVGTFTSTLVAKTIVITMRLEQACVCT